VAALPARPLIPAKIDRTPEVVCRRALWSSFLAPVVQVEHREERLLWHLDRTDLLHSPLAGLLALEELALSG